MSLEGDEEAPRRPPHHLHAEPWRATVAGAVAAGTALGFGELVASLGSSFPSLVAGVGGWLIDRSPGDVTRSVIDALGTANKPVLLTTIVVVSLLVGAVLGRRSVQTPAVGLVGFAGFGLLGAAAAAGEVGATVAGSLTVAIVAAGVGIATLLLLLTAGDGRIPLGADQIESPTDPHASRRNFLGFAGAATAFAGLTASGARVVAGRSPAEVAREAVELPTPTSTIPLAAASFADIDGLEPLYTPNDSFFRIDTALRVPQIEPDSWSLTIDGLVERTLSFTFDELSAMSLVETDVTLACVSNRVGGDLVGNARWLGVPLTDLLDRAGIAPEAEQVVGRSVDGFTAGFPLEALDDGRPALVAIGMNGEPLPLRHGFPARLVVSGLYGYVSATKWLESIELRTWDGFDGYWIPRGWSKEGPVHTQTRIDVPADGARVATGPVAVAGVAWAPSRGIDRVEVRVDDGPWVDAELSDPIGDHAWRQWLHRWEATPGRHEIEVRSTDGTGEVQTAEEQPPAPSGATGRHHIRVEVA